MGTPFLSITNLVRLLLSDTDPSAYQWSDSILAGHMRIVLMSLNEPGLYEDPSSPGNFLNSLSYVDQARMIYRTTKSVVCGQDDRFSYVTPVMSVSRQGGIRQLWAYLQTEIDKVEGGVFPISCDTDLQAIVSGMQRYINDFTNAFSEINNTNSQPVGIPKT